MLLLVAPVGGTLLVVLVSKCCHAELLLQLGHLGLHGLLSLHGSSELLGEHGVGIGDRFKRRTVAGVGGCKVLDSRDQRFFIKWGFGIVACTLGGFLELIEEPILVGKEILEMMIGLLCWVLWYPTTERILVTSSLH